MVRSPIQVDEEFRQKLKKIQKDIMRTKGEFESFPKITKKFIKFPEWEAIEKKMLLEDLKQMDIKINFDRRKQI